MISYTIHSLLLRVSTMFGNSQQMGLTSYDECNQRLKEWFINEGFWSIHSQLVDGLLNIESKQFQSESANSVYWVIFTAVDVRDLCNTFFMDERKSSTWNQSWVTWNFLENILHVLRHRFSKYQTAHEAFWCLNQPFFSFSPRCVRLITKLYNQCSMKALMSISIFQVISK